MVKTISIGIIGLPSYDTEYIPKKEWVWGTTKEKLRYGQAKIHISYTILKQRERLEWCAI